MAVTSAEAGPNVLWITCEDMSPDLGCYGEAYARTPFVDELAAEGVRYTRAFASAPVCSPMRCGLITGLYATSLGTQRLRSAFPVPSEIRPFTAFLRAAGYYCVNNVKTDYNLANESGFIREAWDECSASAHWRGRPEGRPFFAVINLMTTHQSRTSVWSHEEFEREVGGRLTSVMRHDPAHVPLPPYYPDTPEVRRTLARYHDCVSVMDTEVGRILAELDADGLADETIVFFYSDHGAGLPRGKRVLHDSGLQIPLIVRFPERYRSWAPASPGGVCERLISSIDLGPTVLSLTGLRVPNLMQGKAFLGDDATPGPSVVIGARDRVDEAYDLARSVRDPKYLYIRNFMPHRSWMPPEAYSDQSTMRRELRQMAAAGQLNAVQETYAAHRRAVEELYDTRNDPYQVRNLAGSPDYATVLAEKRDQLRTWILEERDAGFASEIQAWEWTRSGQPPREWAGDDSLYPLCELLAVAELVGDPGATARQVELLANQRASIRYWAAVGLNAQARLSDAGVEALAEALSDESAAVRLEAAEALVRARGDREALALLARDLSGERPEVVLRAARALELLGSAAEPARPAMVRALSQAQEREGDMWMFVRFSLGAALSAPE